MKILVFVKQVPDTDDVKLDPKTGNLRRDGVLELIDYLERIPDKLIPRKQELIESIREREKQDGEASPTADGAPALWMNA